MIHAVWLVPLEQLIGLRRFLTHAEQECLNRMPPDTFYTLLPWAVALKVSDAWIHRFARRPVAPPDWYAAPKPLGIAELGGEIKQLHALLRPRGAGGENARRRHETSR
jgi:hypothetical protein